MYFVSNSVVVVFVLFSLEFHETAAVSKKNPCLFLAVVE